MGTKTVRLEEDVYERIKAHKQEGETFSEAIERLIDDYSLLDLAGTTSEDAAAEHMAAVRAAEETQLAETRALLEEMGVEDGGS